MKKIILLIFTIFILVSCKAEIDETEVIVNDYIETLENTPNEAREAVELINNRNQDLNKLRGN